MTARPALLLALGFAAACASDEPHSPNRIPTVLLTSGPVEGDTVLYRIDLSWSGEDPDGSVARYEFAVDPPASFSETEIAEGGPGINEEFIPGEGTNPDVTRMTKQEGSQIVAFDWVHTLETSREFKFSTPTAESSFVSGAIVATGRFHGMHAVYVRAVDDDGAPSSPDKTAFTSVTVAPRSSIVRPNLDGGLILGAMLHASWHGVDLDGPGRRPIGYYYALVRYDPMGIGWPGRPDRLIHSATWTYQDADTSSWTGELTVPHYYVFAVRAVDENGAVEPFLDWGRNAFLFMAQASGGKPMLSIAFNGSTWTFPSSAGPVRLEVPYGRTLEFLLSCSAERYGETCDGYRWGLDLSELDAEDGWSPWTGNTTISMEPATSGIHVLYVQARDALGTTTTGTLILDVVEFAFDREILMVDDSFDDTFPNDAQHDAFWDSMVSNYAATSGLPEDQVSRFDVFGSGDRENLDPRVPTLAELGRFRLVLWQCRGSGYNAHSGLLRLTALSPVLATYLRAGGKLWLGGQLTVGATMAVPGTSTADLTYPKELSPSDHFAWDYLKLHSTRIDRSTGDRPNNLLNRVLPVPGFPAIYDSMVVDLTSLRLDSGISNTEAVFDPILAESEPGFRGDIDSLYVYGAVGPVLLRRASARENCAPSAGTTPMSPGSTDASSGSDSQCIS